jgi:hypothetical protein
MAAPDVVVVVVAVVVVVVPVSLTVLVVVVVSTAAPRGMALPTYSVQFSVSERGE